MLKGLYLTLLIGPVVPMPVPQVGDGRADQCQGHDRHGRQRAASS